jgi:hypothetical protein
MTVYYRIAEFALYHLQANGILGRKDRFYAGTIAMKHNCRTTVRATMSKSDRLQRVRYFTGQGPGRGRLQHGTELLHPRNIAFITGTFTDGES